ncbi:hypothetical protein EsH8_X_000446 [Colletotrichum jinshuiense]
MDQDEQQRLQDIISDCFREIQISHGYTMTQIFQGSVSFILQEEGQGSPTLAGLFPGGNVPAGIFRAALDNALPAALREALPAALQAALPARFSIQPQAPGPAAPAPALLAPAPAPPPAPIGNLAGLPAPFAHMGPFPAPAPAPAPAAAPLAQAPAPPAVPPALAGQQAAGQQRPFVCSHPGCGKNYTQQNSLNRHVRDKH